MKFSFFDLGFEMPCSIFLGFNAVHTTNSFPDNFSCMVLPHLRQCPT